MDMVSIMVFLAISITDTLSEIPAFATYARRLSGLTATPAGSLPMGMTAITLFLSVSITETVLFELLVEEFPINTLRPSGLAATPKGSTKLASVIVVITLFFFVLITDTVPVMPGPGFVM